MIISNRTLGTICLLTILVSGCASKSPSFGSSVKAEGKHVAAIGEKWEKGQDLVKKGNKRIRKGNDQIENGNENIAEGKAMIKTGEKLIAESEAAYKRLESPE